MTRFAEIVGLDLSLTSTGLARIGTDIGRRPVVCTVKSSGDKDATWAARYSRMCRIRKQIADEIPYRSRCLVMLEAPSYASTNGSQHDRSGLWWMVHEDLLVRGHTVLPVAPKIRAKYATGKGNASKDAVLAATVRRHPDIEIDGNDIADAVNLMAIGCRLFGWPFDDPMPALNLTALATLSLPEEA